MADSTRGGIVGATVTVGGGGWSFGRARARRDKLPRVRLPEILGETARAVPEPTRSGYPGILWRQRAGSRDCLTHGYEVVDLDSVWAIVTRDLPPPVTELERALAADQHRVRAGRWASTRRPRKRWCAS